jgi:dTDP-glucose 4,6-dehydratase
MKLLVTGGAGFIGSAVVRAAIARGDEVVCLDALTYCANLENLAPVAASPRYAFERADIADGSATSAILARHQPDAVLHLAAETHVDRSIDGPMAFVHTNVLGTAALLQSLRGYWEALPADRRERFRLVHVSTDEVFGELGPEGRFDEASPYAPSSPYSASKAAADHMVRAWGRTFGLPAVVTNCGNNYGPYQFPEKLIPVVILGALDERPIPLYGRGENVRDWLYVEDHAEALLCVADAGQPGETYCVGGESEIANHALVEIICAELDKIRPRAQGRYADLITPVADRPGHDFRYAIDPSKLRRELGWSARTPLDGGLARTVRWYVDNPGWWTPLQGRGFSPERRGLAAGGAR